MKMKIQVLIVLCLFRMSVFGQDRDITIKYQIITPSTGSAYQSPGYIPVTFNMVNLGPDTLFSNDTFVYYITHSLDNNQQQVRKRIAIGKTVAPGDSTEIYSDTIDIDWPNWKPQEFILSILCDYFTAGVGSGHTPFDVDFVSNQDSLRSVLLLHLGNVSVDKVTTIGAPKLYPNPSSSGKFNLTFNNLDLKSEGPIVNVYDLLGKEVDFDYENNVLSINGLKGTYIAVFNYAGTSFYRKLIIN